MKTIAKITIAKWQALSPRERAIVFQRDGKRGAVSRRLVDPCQICDQPIAAHAETISRTQDRIAHAWCVDEFCPPKYSQQSINMEPEPPKDHLMDQAVRVAYIEAQTAMLFVRLTKMKAANVVQLKQNKDLIYDADAFAHLEERFSVLEATNCAAFLMGTAPIVTNSGGQNEPR